MYAKSMLLTLLLALSLLVTSAAAQDGPKQIGLEPIAGGLVAPVDLETARDGTGRLFILDQIGLIHTLTAEGELLEEPFLDVRDQMVSLNERYDERGLLGLAFHPNYAENGRFFVYYSAPLRPEGPEDWNHTSHLSEFTVSEENANLADPDSERILMEIDQPQSNHNGGDLAFGPDGYLYIVLGDGGGANDTGTGHTPDIGNAQDTTNLLGSILRINVEEEPYGIPEDNPFVDDDAGRDEIWAWGLRNAWRMSFDPETRRLFAADVGQNLYEEVNIIESGNYGWNIREGFHCFDPEAPRNPPQSCTDTGYQGEPLNDPIIEYSHDTGISIAGGFAYRGEALGEAFQGLYFFGDWSAPNNQPNAKIFIASEPDSEGEPWPWWEAQIVTQEGGLSTYLLSFGEDADGEIYMLTSQTLGPTGETGEVWKIVSAE